MNILSYTKKLTGFYQDIHAIHPFDYHHFQNPSKRNRSNKTYNIVNLEYSSHRLCGEAERGGGDVQRLQHVLVAHVGDAAAAHVDARARRAARVRRAQLGHRLDGVQT